MPTDTKLDQLIINYLTEDQYKALTDIDENQLYFTIDESAVYQPLEVTFTGDSDKSIKVTLTDEQYNQILSAINNKEEIIAYGNYNLGGQAIKLPLIQPIKTLDNGTILVYSGVCGYMNYVLGSSTMNWTLIHNLNGDGSHVLGLLNVPEFSKGFGIYISSSVTNEMSFADGAGYYDWNQSQGNKIKFDSINGKPILHTSADINSYYAPTTINDTATAKILSSKNSTMEWIDLPTQKQYFKHAIQIPINESAISILITNSTNTAITDVTAINTALGSATQYPCSGAFKNGENVCMAVSYNATTSKVKVFNGTALEEIALATAGTITLGTITDEVI